MTKSSPSCPEAPTTLRILGIDPGSAATGWSLIEASGNRYRLLDCGVLRPRGDERADRLAALHAGVRALVERWRPGAAAVEAAFAGRNPRSGLALAESRGAVLAALGHSSLPVYTYSPAEVKSAVVGHGRAEKDQVVFMVVRLLKLERAPAHDAADAAAVALTHLHHSRWRRLPQHTE